MTRLSTNQCTCIEYRAIAAIIICVVCSSNRTYVHGECQLMALSPPLLHNHTFPALSMPNASENLHIVYITHDVYRVPCRGHRSTAPCSGCQTPWKMEHSYTVFVNKVRVIYNLFVSTLPLVYKNMHREHQSYVTKYLQCRL